ncbi:MAG: hypothetical protein HFE26_05450 [Clostridia bacterium]|nr:hypothetical protein [Clostridia bacterium]
MKYFTKEWLIREELSYLDNSCIKKKNLKLYSEDVFQFLFAQTRQRFVKREQSLDYYQDANAEIQRIDAKLTNPNLSEHERELLNTMRYVIYESNKTRIESGKIYPFDREHSEKSFQETYRQQIELIKQLPPHILKHVKDIRILALGYASPQTVRQLKRYCAKLRRMNRKIKMKAYHETDCAEDFLRAPIGLNNFDSFLYGIEIRKNDVYIHFDFDVMFIIKNGRITERESDKIYQFSIDYPNSGWSKLEGAELHRRNTEYELNFLFTNSDEYQRSEAWYFTVVGTDVIRM